MIHNYAELVAEVQRISGISDFASRAAMVVGFAEDFLNKHLRLQDMEEEATLTTDDEGRADLPDGLVAVRSVRTNFFGKTVEFTKRTPTAIRVGFHVGWAIERGKFLSTEKEADHTLLYYKEIPSLQSEGTSFLLEKESEMYLNAVLFKAFADVGDMESSIERGNYTRALIDSANAQDEELRMARTSVQLRGGP